MRNQQKTPPLKSVKGWNGKTKTKRRTAAHGRHGENASQSGRRPIDLAWIVQGDGVARPR
jgi:hypothetical protein